MSILAMITEATCGDSCWTAREDICKCSCNGINHGCLNSPGGLQPNRTSKIDGYRYELKSIGAYSDLLDITEKINKKVPSKI